MLPVADTDVDYFEMSTLKSRNWIETLRDNAEEERQLQTKRKQRKVVDAHFRPQGVVLSQKE